MFYCKTGTNFNNKLEKLKIKVIESFIVKLEQFFVFGGNYSRVVTYIRGIYIYIYIRIRGQASESFK